MVFYEHNKGFGHWTSTSITMTDYILWTSVFTMMAIAVVGVIKLYDYELQYLQLRIPGLK